MAWGIGVVQILAQYPKKSFYLLPRIYKSITDLFNFILSSSCCTKSFNIYNGSEGVKESDVKNKKLRTLAKA
jgi:hypothetical protein